jgi:hypothetical protein
MRESSYERVAPSQAVCSSPQAALKNESPSRILMFHVPFIKTDSKLNSASDSSSMDHGGRRVMKDRSRNGGRLGLCSILLLICLHSPEYRVKAFVIENLQQQTLQTRPSRPIMVNNMKRINFNTDLERRHAHTSVICKMASEGPESDDAINDLYRIVAEQDPEWFQDFVTNVLGEESVDKELLALSRTKTASAAASREKKVVETVPKTESPSEEESVYKQMPPEIKKAEAVVAAASATITEENVPSAKEVKSQDENEEHETESLSVEEKATDMGGEESLDDEVAVVSSTDTNEDLDETIPLPVVAEDEDEVFATSSSDTDEDLDETDASPVAIEKEDEVVKSNEPLPQSNESTVLDDEKAEASSDQEPSSDRIILYRDAYSQSFMQVDLVDVLSLGYLEFEICSLEADTLDLIASDGIVKPRSGVPSRWKIKSGQPAQVRILSKSQADQIVSDETGKKKEGRREKVIDIKESTSAKTDTLDDELDPAVPTRESLNEEIGPVSREGESRRGEADRMRPPRSKAATESARGERPSSTARKSQARGEREESPRERPPSPRRERSSKRADRGEGERRMYDGRPSPSSPKSKRKRDDPPSPNSPVWVDIDTFRGLLRSEAGLRLRILGDDWADTVKEESDWRLDLYKEWLWTLHNGVGKPIVESRSDRMRRKRGGGTREDDKRDPPARRPRKRRER